MSGFFRTYLTFNFLARFHLSVSYSASVKGTVANSMLLKLYGHLILLSASYSSRGNPVPRFSLLGRVGENPGNQVDEDVHSNLKSIIKKIIFSADSFPELGIKIQGRRCFLVVVVNKVLQRCTSIR